MTPLQKELGTARQIEYLQAIEAHGNQTSAAAALGIDRSTIAKSLTALKAKCAKRGESPEHDMTHQVPTGYQVKGTSTLYGEDGQPRMQWVKTAQDWDIREKLMREAVEALCQDVKPIKPRKADKGYNRDIMAVYPLGDPHIGMLSWADETGQDWDLMIAEDKFTAVFDRLVKTAPRCDECCIVNLGDYFHYDNMEGVTTRSGHSLDVDSRYAKMVKIGIRIMRRMIESALEHHKKVRIINATGNHDDTSSMFLNVALANIYEKEKRVTVDESPTPYHYVQFGKTCFGVHHGHSTKMPALPGVMATDRPQMWGECLHRYWFTGHIHHDSMKEYAGCKVESFRTLAAKDAYAAWGGYRAGQDSKAIILHKEYGEVERHTINLQMV